jgi:plasmid stability protein
MTLTIELPPEIDRWLKQEAARHGQDVRDYTRALLEQIMNAAESKRERELLPGGVQRRSPVELLTLARAQGVKSVDRFEDLLGDWSDAEDGEEFDVEAFLQARRQWQQEDRFPFAKPDETPVRKRQA